MKYLISNLLLVQNSFHFTVPYPADAHFCHYLNTLDLHNQFANVVTSFQFFQFINPKVSICLLASFYPQLSRGSRVWSTNQVTQAVPSHGLMLSPAAFLFDMCCKNALLGSVQQPDLQVNGHPGYHFFVYIQVQYFPSKPKCSVRMAGSTKVHSINHTLVPVLPAVSSFGVTPPVPLYLVLLTVVLCTILSFWTFHKIFQTPVSPGAFTLTSIRVNHIRCFFLD